jgi:dihydrofolate synthase/folylpolyglutamate synthase
VERVAESVAVVDRALSEGDAVTQFEAATAAAFVALANARVEVGVIEAGLGGRLDATNVIPSRVTALTSIGLEHTQWLGDTELEIATEKLAVLRDHTTLVIGPLSTEVERLARRTAADRHARLVSVRDLSPQVAISTPAPYLRRNFAVALASAEAMLGSLDPERVADVAGHLELHGRMEVIESDPPLVLDAAHNPDGAAALAEALPRVAGGRPVVACMALLADKDAAAVLAALGASLAALIATEIPAEVLARAGRPGAKARAASELADVARRAGVGHVEEVEDPAAAVRRARELASLQGGVALVCGSHYLLGYTSK